MNWAQTIPRCLLFPLAGVFVSHILGWGQLMVRILLPPAWWHRLTAWPKASTPTIFWAGAGSLDSEIRATFSHSSLTLMHQLQTSWKLSTLFKTPKLLPVDLRTKLKILNVTSKALVFFISLNIPCSFWPQELCTLWILHRTLAHHHLPSNCHFNPTLLFGPTSHQLCPIKM